MNHPFTGDLSPPSWIQIDPVTKKAMTPDLSSASDVSLSELRDSVKNEGLLAYYIALCVTDLGTE